MKKKVKKFAEGGYGRFTEDSPKSVEDMKSGLFAGAPSDEPEVRSYSVTGPNTDVKPSVKPRAAAPKVKTGSGASGFGLKDPEMESASSVMKRGQAGASASGKNVALAKLMADRKVAAFNAERKANAEERKKTARSTTSAIPYNDVNPNQFKMFEKDSYKKGGSVKSASARADGCAIRGKTRA
jgi:hypothetical protein